MDVRACCHPDIMSPRYMSVILIYSDCTELYHCCASSPDMGEKQCGLHGVMIHVFLVLFTLTTTWVQTEERVTEYQHRNEQIKASRPIQHEIFCLQIIFLLGASVPVSMFILYWLNLYQCSYVLTMDAAVTWLEKDAAGLSSPFLPTK